MAERTLTLNIVGDASSLHRAMGSAEVVTGKFGGGIMGLLKHGLALGAGMDIMGRAIDGAVNIVKGGYDAFKEQQGVMAQTDAVIKSTGGAANVSSKQINDLAGSLAALSGQDDMAIQKGENLLATFTSVRNETGKGNDIFNQATKTMVDMSVALGQDTKSSAIQLGKALNDPIKGVTALQRVGVSFTEDQKKQIKTLVESGKTMEAQKLILGELSKEFGGSAAAAGKTYEAQIAKLKEKFEDVQIAIAEKVIPVLVRMLEWVNANWPKIEKVITTVINNVSAAIGPLKAVFGSFFSDTGTQSETFKTVFKTVGDIVAQVVGFVRPLIQQYATFMVGQFGMVVTWFKANWPLISATVKTVMTAIKAVFDYTWPVIQAVVTTAFNVIKTVASTGLKAMLGIIKAVMQIITGDWKGAWETLKDVVKTVFSGIKSLVRDLVGGFIDIGKNLVESIWRGIGSMAGWIAGKVRAFISDHITQPIKSALDISSPSRVFAEIGQNIGQGLVVGIGQSASLVEGAMGAVMPTLSFGAAKPGSFASYGAALGLAGGGGGVQILISGNYISDRYDIERIGDDLVSYLRRKGVKL